MSIELQRWEVVTIGAVILIGVLIIASIVLDAWTERRNRR